MARTIPKLLPNLITLGRLVMVPLAVWMIGEGHFSGAFYVFVTAGVSDALDGFLAKRFDARTKLGGFLDPLADKALLVSVYLALGHGGHMPLWLVILVVFRDILIVGGALLFYTLTQTLRMRPLIISKINTFFQIVLAADLLASLGLGFHDRGFAGFLMGAVTLTTVASGLSYVVLWTRRAARMEEGREG